MNPLLVDMGLALWFGILTSISPCPLATNLTAISFIGRKVGRAGYVFSAGMLYMLGRMLTYSILGAILVSSTQLISPVAMFLQTYMVYLLGPGLILFGVLLLDVIKLNFGGGLMNDLLQARIERAGIWGAGLMGIVFALSFCPISAGLFFGSLFGLAMQRGSTILLPSLYGVGTALPVLAFAFLLAFSANRIGRVFDKLSAFEHWARRVTALIMIAAGLYLCVTQII
ncbi:cytochrome c biogenesis protein, transmembrane region [Candidatus Moduliflexus flocculans]|uniref:Cytochrome c biogenesis protein, transmembrane region n=1 Tax=Candidatus Moduliflexus flocculans TaxID=1499966 RepID=A0A081BST6_9BACT|nr:cytochrome c biogenesis protein, transmembrane region [Candidatus Moduliflexus flocculans]